MFSTTPRIGQCTWRNILTARVASSSATSCGVVTITAPSSETCCASVNCASPVPGGKIDDQEILRAPQRVFEKLPHRAHHHRSAPDNRRLLAEKKSDRDQLHAVLLDRVEILPARRLRPLVSDVEHHRHRRPVDVGVEQADAEPQARERHRDIRRDRGFADTALAAAHRDDVLGTFEPHAPGLLAELGFDPMHPQLDARHAKVVGQRAMDACRQLADHLIALGNLSQSDRIPAILRRLRILDQPKRDDVSGVPGILYVSKSLDNRVVRNLSCH